MDLQTAGKTLSQPYQQMASTPRDTGSPEIRVKEVEPLKKLLLSGPDDPFMPSSPTHEPNTLLPPPSPVHEESLATSLITDSELEFKSPYEETLATVFMDIPPLLQTAKEPHPFSKLTELPSTSASEDCEEDHGGDKRTRANFIEQRRRNHQAELYQNLRDTLGVTTSTPRQTIVTVCIKLISLSEGTSFQPEQKKQKIVEPEAKQSLSKTEWHNYLERKRRNKLKKSLGHLKECLKLPPKTKTTVTLAKCLEKTREITKRDDFKKIHFIHTQKKRKTCKKTYQPLSRHCLQEKYQNSITEKKIEILSTREENRSIEQNYLDKIKTILCIPKKSTHQLILANALHFIKHGEKPTRTQVKNTLSNIKSMTSNKKKQTLHYKVNNNIERFLIALIKNELNKSGFSINGKGLQKTKVLLCLLSWFSNHSTKEGVTNKGQNKAHIAIKRKNSSPDQEGSTPKKKSKPFPNEKKLLHNEENYQVSRPSGRTTPTLSAAQLLLAKPENSFPQSNIPVEHLTEQSSLRQLLPSSQPEEAIYDYRNASTYADNSALPDSPNDRTSSKVMVIDLNRPTLIQFPPPPQVMEYHVSSLDTAPQTVRNMSKRYLSSPETKRAYRQQNLLASLDKSLEPRSNEMQTRNILQHRVPQQGLLTKTAQPNELISQKLEEQATLQNSLLFTLLKKPKSVHLQDRQRLTSNSRPLKTDDSYSCEISDRTMINPSSWLHFIAHPDSPEKPASSSSNLDSKFLLNDEAEASEVTVNPEELVTPAQSDLSEPSKESDELRENMGHTSRKLDERTTRRLIDLEENSRLKEQITRLEEQLTQFKKHEPLRALTKCNLSTPTASPSQCPPTCSQPSTNPPITPTVFAKVRELSSLLGLPNDSDSNMHQLDKVLEGAVALARECKMNDQPFFGQLKDNIPAFIKTQDQNSLLALIAEKGSQINVIRKLLDNINEKAAIGKNELEAHLKQIQRDIEYLTEKIRVIPSAQINRKKTMMGQADQLTTLNTKTRDLFEREHILLLQLIEHVEKQRQLLLEEAKHYQSAMDA